MNYSQWKLFDKNLQKFVAKDFGEIFDFTAYIENLSSSTRYKNDATSYANRIRNNTLMYHIFAFLCYRLELQNDDSGDLAMCSEICSIFESVTSIECNDVSQLVYDLKYTLSESSVNEDLNSYKDIVRDVITKMSEQNVDFMVGESVNELSVHSNLTNAMEEVENTVIRKIKECIDYIDNLISFYSEKGYDNSSILYSIIKDLNSGGSNDFSKIYMVFNISDYPVSKVLKAHEKIFSLSNETLQFNNMRDDREYDEFVLPYFIVVENENAPELIEKMNFLNCDYEPYITSHPVNNRRAFVVYPNKKQRLFIKLDREELGLDLTDFYTPSFVEYVLTHHIE